MGKVMNDDRGKLKELDQRERKRYLEQLMGMFTTPILKKYYAANNQREYSHSDKEYKKINFSLTHLFSPLSKNVAMINSPTEKRKPLQNIKDLSPLPDINWPKTRAANVSLAISANHLAKFSRCLLLSPTLVKVYTLLLYYVNLAIRGLWAQLFLILIPYYLTPSPKAKASVFTRYLFLLVFALILTFSPWEKGTAWEWTDTGGGDHGGADWTPANGTVISGYHYNIGNFTVATGTTVYVNAYDGTPAWNSLILLPSGRGVADNGPNPSGFIEIEAATATIDGMIEGSGRGYGGGQDNTPGKGPGGGMSTNVRSGGGGYGGAGGNGTDGAGGNLYGSVYEPFYMGSGGGGYTSSYPGGSGGGLIIIKATSAFTLSGTGKLQANGNGGTTYPSCCVYNGGGAGGGISIEAPIITIGNNAILSAAGGGAGYTSAGQPGLNGNGGNSGTGLIGGGPGVPGNGGNYNQNGGNSAGAGAYNCCTYGGGGGGAGRVTITYGKFNNGDPPNFSGNEGYPTANPPNVTIGPLAYYIKTPINPPTGLTAVQSWPSVQLSWINSSQPPAVTNYLIYRSADAMFFILVSSVPVTENNFTDYPPQATPTGGLLYYKVRAINSSTGDTSTHSNMISVTPPNGTWTLTGGGDHEGRGWMIPHETTISGYHYNIGNFSIAAGATIYINAYDGSTVTYLSSGRGNVDNGTYGGTPSGFIEIEAATVTINGSIDGSAKGYLGATGGLGENGTVSNGYPGNNSTGPSNGGNGGSGASNCSYSGGSGGSGTTYLFSGAGPLAMGGGGAGGGGGTWGSCGDITAGSGNTGGKGGTAILIKSSFNITINGQLNVNGGTGGNTVDYGNRDGGAGGGGGGGSIYLEAPNVSIPSSARITSVGGSGGVVCCGEASPGFAGSNGAIIINYSNQFNGGVVNGGSPGYATIAGITPNAYYRWNKPNKPTGLWSPSSTPTSVDFSWTAPAEPPNIAKYWVEKTNDQSRYLFDNGYVVVATVTAPSTQVLGIPLVPNETAWFRVCAIDYSNTKSDYSGPPVKITAAPNPPSVTSNKTINTWYILNTNVTSTTDWGTNGAAYYRYLWEQSATPSAAITTSNGTRWDSGTGANITLSLTAGGYWYLHVKSFNSNDNGGQTNTYGPFNCDSSAPPLTPLLTPTNSSVLNDTPTFNWSYVTDFSPGSGVQSYDIEVSTSSNFIPMKWSSNTTTSPIKWDTWTPADSGTFYWHMRAKDVVNNGSWAYSTPWSFNIDMLPPDPITNLAASSDGTDKELILTWTAPGDDGVSGTATGYQVRYSQTGAITSTTAWTNATAYPQSWSPGTPGSTETKTLTGLAAGTYYFQVRTMDDAGALSGLATTSSSATAMQITKLIYSTAPVTMTVGDSTGTFTVVSVDGSNTPIKVNKTTNLNVASTSGQAKFATSFVGPYNPGLLTVPLADGATSVTFYYTDTLATSPGVSTITVTCPTETWTSTATGVKLNPRPPAKLAFVTPSYSLQAGGISPPIRLQTQDEYNNPSSVGSPIVVNLTTTTADGKFYLGASTTSQQTNLVNIGAGSYEATFYFWPSQIGNSTVQATTPSGLTGTQQTYNVSPGPTSKIVFIQGAGQPLTAGQPSNVIRGEFQDIFGNPSVPGTCILGTTCPRIVPTSTSGGAKFSFDGFSWYTSTYTDVPGGITTFNMYYKDTAVGISTLTVTNINNSGWTAGTSAFTITPSTITQIVFTRTFSTLSVGQISPILEIQTRDFYNNPSPVTGVTRTIQLRTDSTNGYFFLAPSTIPWNPAPSVELAPGISSTTFYYHDTRSGPWVLRATSTVPADNWAHAQLSVQIQGGTITKLAVKTFPADMNAGDVAGPMTIETRDAQDNPSGVVDGVTLILNSDSSGCNVIGSCFSLSSSTTTWLPVSLITISAGASLSQNFYYRDMKANYPYSNPIITATAQGTSWQAATQTQTIHPASVVKLGVASSTQTINAGDASGQIIIQTQDQYGNPQNPGMNITVNIGAPTAGSPLGQSQYIFSQNPTIWPSAPGVTFVEIPTSGSPTPYQPNSPLYYKAFASGIHTLSFSASLPVVGSTSTYQDIKVIGFPSRIVFTGTSSPTLAAGTTTFYTVETKDNYNNVAPVRQDTYLTLNSSSPGANFSLNGTIWLGKPPSGIPVLVPNGLSSASFYYKDTKSGNWTISVSSAPLLPATTSLAVISGPAEEFIFVHPSSSTVLTQVPVTIKAFDQYDNVADGYTGSINITALPANGGAAVSPTNHTFIPSDNGVKQVYLNDSFTETAYVKVQDTVTPTITGTSNGIPFHGLIAEMTDSIMPTVCTQNQKNIGIARIQLMTSTGTSTINAFTVWLSTGITNTDIAKVKLYEDTTPNGVFEPGVGEVPGADLVLVESTFSASGQVTLTLPSPHVINNVPRYYFVAYDLATEATLYANVGARIMNPGFFSIIGGLPMGSNNLPWSSKTIPIFQTPRTITVTPSDIYASNSVLQGKTDTGLIKFTLATDAGTAGLSGFRINKLAASTLRDSDISKLIIFRDFGGQLGGYDPGIDTRIFTTTSAFQSGLALVQLSTPEVVGVTPQTYFIAVDISPSAQVGAILGLGFTSNSYFTPTELHLVSPANFPFNGDLISVTPTNDTMFVNPTNLAPSDVLQGTRNLAMARVALKADANTVLWKALSLAFDGTATGASVDAVKIYRDNGVASPPAFSASSDTLITTGVDIFTNNQAVINLLEPEIIGTTYQNYFIVFDVSYLGSVGKSVGGQWLTGSAFILDGPFDRVNSNAGAFSFGPSSVKEYADTVTATFAAPNFAPASISQGSANVAIAKFSLSADRAEATWSKVGVGVAGSAPYSAYKAVKIYLDANGSGNFEPTVDTLISPENLTFTTSLLEIPLSPVQTVRTIAKNYFVVIDLAADAPEGGRLAVSFSGSSAFIISFPNIMSGTNLPYTSGEVTIAPVRVNPRITNLLSPSMGQGDIGVRVMRLDLNTDVSSTYVNSLKLTRTGQGSDLDLTAVEFYRDNGDSRFDAQSDIFLAASSLANGEVQISLQQPELVTTSSQTYFVTLNVAGDAGVGNTLGLQLPFDAFSLSWGSVQLNSLPFATGAAFIKDYRTPSTPSIDHGGKFTSSFSQLRTKYDSKVTVGRITDVEYAIGTSSGATNVVTWTKTSVSTEILTNNLALENGKTYFVCVKTKSDSGFWSETGCSEGVTVDRVKPAIPKPPRAFIEGKTVSVEWDSAQVGVSGVKGYRVEIKPGDKPAYIPLSALKGVIQWSPVVDGVPGDTEAATAAASEMVNTTAMVLQNIPYSSFYLRVTPVNGADVEGESSPPLKVIVWLPEDVIASISCYPNPFDSRKESIIINYLLNQDAEVRIRIYDVFGIMIHSASYAKSGTGGIQGPNDVTWDGTDDNGNKVSQGVYIVILEANGHKKRVKVGLRH